MESPPSLPRFRRRRRRRSASALTAARSAAVSASSTASVHASSVHASVPLPPVRQSRWRISTSAESIDDPPPQPPSISLIPPSFSDTLTLGVASDVASAPPRSLASDIAPLTLAPTTARPHVPPSSTPDTDANSPSNAAIAPASAPAPRTASSQHSARSHAMDRSAFRPFTDDTTHRTSGVSSDGVPALSPVTRPSILRNAPSKDVTHSPRPTHSRVTFTTPNIASNDAYAIPRIDDVSLVPPGKLRRAADSRASATSAAAPATHALDSAGSDPGCPRVRYHGRHPARSIATGADNSSEAPHAVRTSLACSADLNPAPTALSSERSA